MSVEIHDEYGCSRHDGLLLCLGYKPGAAGDAATEGTELHHIAEQIIKSDWKAYQFPDMFASGKLFTDEHKNIVLDYTDYIRKTKEKYTAEFGADLVMEVEHKVSIPSLEIEVSTIDTLFYVPFQFIHVVDLKTGQTPVLPTSAQMRGYILGAKNVCPATSYAATIVQPKLEPAIKTAKFSALELTRHEAMMQGILRAAKRDNAPCTPCKYCSWCARNGTCPATKAQLAMVSVDADKKELSMESLALLTAYAMDIETIIGSLKQRAYAVLEAGGQLPLPDGRELMLVDGRPTRVWRSEKEAKSVLEALAVSKLGVEDPEAINKLIYEYKEPTMLSPSKAEGVFGKSKAVKAQIDPLVFSKEGNKKLGIVKQITQGESNG